MGRQTMKIIKRWSAVYLYHSTLQEIRNTKYLMHIFALFKCIKMILRLRNYKTKGLISLPHPIMSISHDASLIRPIVSPPPDLVSNFSSAFQQIPPLEDQWDYLTRASPKGGVGRAAPVSASCSSNWTGLPITVQFVNNGMTRQLRSRCSRRVKEWTWVLHDGRVVGKSSCCYR